MTIVTLVVYIIAVAEDDGPLHNLLSTVASLSLEVLFSHY